MKQRNSAGKKAVALTTAASILGTSCSGYLEHPLSEDDSATKKESNLKGTRSLPICDDLTEDEYAFVDAIIRLTEDLINENIDSSTLNDDSKNVLESYGYTGEIVMDEDLEKILSAFGNKEFVDAIRNQDVESFINIAQVNGLLRRDINPSKEYNGFESLPEPTKQLITKIKKTRIINNKEMVIQQEISDWFVDSIAVAAVIALVGIEVAVIVMVVVIGAANNNQISATEKFSTQVAFNKLMNARNVDAWDAFIQRNGSTGLYTFIDHRITKLCDVTISAIDEIYPEYWNNHSEVEIRNALGITFMNYLFESEK